MRLINTNHTFMEKYSVSEKTKVNKADDLFKELQEDF